MEVKAGNIHFLGPQHGVQTIQAAQYARLHLGVDLRRPTFLLTPVYPKDGGRDLRTEALDNDPSPG
jgi:hypothetical protein